MLEISTNVGLKKDFTTQIEKKIKIDQNRLQNGFSIKKKKNFNK